MSPPPHESKERRCGDYPGVKLNSYDEKLYDSPGNGKTSLLGGSPSMVDVKITSPKDEVSQSRAGHHERMQKSDSTFDTVQTAWDTEQLLDAASSTERNLKDENPNALVDSLGLPFTILNALLSLISVVLYVITTYSVSQDLLDIFDILEWFLNAYFVLNWLYCLYIAERKWRYITSWTSICDIVSLLPMLGDVFSFARAFRMFRVLRVLRVLRVTHIAAKAQSEVIELYMSLAIVIFLAAGVIRAIEEQYVDAYPQRDVTAFNQPIEFHDAMYYAVFAFTTLGSSGIWAEAWIARLLVSALVICALVYIALVIRRLYEINIHVNPYATAKHLQRGGIEEHVVLCGSFSNRQIKNILMQLTHPQRNQLNVMFTILGRDYPCHFFIDMQRKATDLSYRTTYLQGSPLSAHDCRRAKIDEACVTMVLTNTELFELGSTGSVRTEARREDSAAIHCAMHLRRYYPKNRIVVQLLLLESKPAMDGLGMEVMCIEEMRAAMLAHGAAFQGSAFLVSNLMRCMEVPPIIEDAPPWQQEYTRGLDNEIYKMDMPPETVGLPLKAVIQTLYTKHGVTLIGLAWVKSQRCLVNPPLDYKVSAGDSAFVICSDWTILRRLSNEMTVDQRQLIKESDFLHKTYPAECINPLCEAFRPLAEITIHGYGNAANKELEGCQEALDDVRGALSASGRRNPALATRLFEEARTKLDRYITRIERRIHSNSGRGPHQVSSELSQQHGHIIFCGEFIDAEPFLEAIGSSFIVVVLSEKAITPAQEKAAAAYTNIFLVEGSPLNVNDLRKVAVENALSCILLDRVGEAQDEVIGDVLREITTIKQTANASYEQTPRDRQTHPLQMLAARQVCATSPCHVLMEACTSGSLVFLNSMCTVDNIRLNDTNAGDGVVETHRDCDCRLLWKACTPEMASGCISEWAQLDCLVLQTLYVPSASEMFFQLLGTHRRGPRQMRLRLVHVPARFCSRSKSSSPAEWCMEVEDWEESSDPSRPGNYQDFFLRCLEEGLVVIGLLRSPCPQLDCDFPYLLTNPDRRTWILPGDQAYIIGPSFHAG